MNREQYSNFYPITAFKIQTICSDTTTSGEIIDSQGYDSALISIQAGTITAGTITSFPVHASSPATTVPAISCPSVRGGFETVGTPS